MKLNKFFMLGLAGLAFTACSNEEDAVPGTGDKDKVMITLSWVRLRREVWEKPPLGSTIPLRT